MTGRRSDLGTVCETGYGVDSLRRFAQRCLQGGLVLGAASLLGLAAATPALVGVGGVPTAGRVASLLGASAATLSGAALAFHVAALGLLAGVWLLGLGFLLDGLFGR